MSLVIFVAVVGLFIFGVVYIAQQASKRREHFMQQLAAFAQQKGFDFYVDYKAGTRESGSLPRLTQTTTLNYALTGVVQGFPVKFFKHAYTVGTGRSKRTVEVIVAAVDLPHYMPHMVIDSLVENGDRSALPVLFDRSQKIELEGDFSKFFTVYAPDQRELDALILLAPDVMLAMLEQTVQGDIEFIDKKMYVYMPHETSQISAYEQAFDSVSNILGEVGAKLQRFNKASIMPQPAAISMKPYTPVVGARLKRRKTLIASGALIFVFFFAVQVMNAASERFRFTGGPVALFETFWFVVVIVALIWAAYRAYRKNKLRTELHKRYGK